MSLGGGNAHTVAAGCCCLLFSRAARAGDELTIGITQFPSTLNPNIEVMAAKSYVLGAALRPFTVYDPNGSRVSSFRQGPSIEKGDAVAVDLPDGKKGIDIAFTIRPSALGGWRAGDDRGCAVYLRGGAEPASAVSNAELYRRITAITVKDDKSFTLHIDKLTFDYAG